MAEKAYDYQSQKNEHGYVEGGVAGQSARRGNPYVAPASSYARDYHTAQYESQGYTYEHSPGANPNARPAEHSRQYAPNAARPSAAAGAAQREKVHADERRALRRKMALALASIGVITCLFVQVYQMAQLAQSSAQASQLQQQLGQLESERQNLEVRLGQLNNVTCIERKATSMGMAYATEDQIQMLILP